MESDAKYSNLYFKNGGNVEYNDNSSIFQSNSRLLRGRSAPTSVVESCMDEESNNKNAMGRFAAVSSQLPPQYPSPRVNQLIGPSTMDGEEYGGSTSMGVDHHHHHHHVQSRLGNYTLMKQNTSPAGWFANLSSHGVRIDNWADEERIGNNSIDGEPFFSSGFRYASWNDSADVSTAGGKIKREMNIDRRSYCNFTSQKVETENKPRVLSRRLSLPSIAEKILRMQDTVPCKIRAKRGCATHPRSIAERVRRTRISERMRKLHELVPSMDKQTNTADMLELAVEYIKRLQRQYEMLSDDRANCKCSASEMLASNQSRRSS